MEETLIPTTRQDCEKLNDAGYFIHVHGTRTNRTLSIPPMYAYRNICDFNPNEYL